MKYLKNAKVETDDFWYDLFEEGRIQPVKLLKNEEDIFKILDAVNTLLDWRNELENKEIIEYN